MVRILHVTSYGESAAAAVAEAAAAGCGSDDGGGGGDASPIPKIIWSYWNDAPAPPLVALCVASWMQHNPGWTVRLLNRATADAWLPRGLSIATAPPVMRETPNRTADWLRLVLIEEHGGVWLDASCIGRGPLDAALSSARAAAPGACFFGWELARYADAARAADSPIIENWAFAAPSHSPFVRAWAAALAEMNGYDTPQAYVDAAVAAGVDAQGIPPPVRAYLAMHVAAQAVLQGRSCATSPPPPLPADTTIALWRAEEGPLRYLAARAFHSVPAIKDLMRDVPRRARALVARAAAQRGDGPRVPLPAPFDKLRASEREALARAQSFYLAIL